MDWLRTDEDYAKQYARAREDQAALISEETLKIADDATDDPNSRRVRIYARQWFLSKIHPKKYGDKITQEHTGEGGGPVSVTVNFVKSIPRQGTEPDK